ncbi:MAG: sterol desaturase family protein [Pseudomonadales bacterium]|nr:sterol desaturase family protein [Pseudomonadales bacterium]
MFEEFLLSKGMVGTFAIAAGGNFLRYCLFASLGYLLFYIIMKQRWQHMKVQSAAPGRKQLLREFLLSVMAFCIFGLEAIIVFHPAILPYTQFYFDIHQHSMAWLGCSILLMIVIHDAYFYWMHRLLHSRLLYRTTHATHHTFNNPSPWAGYAFHPIEAIFEGGIIFVFAFDFPVHPLALFVFVLWSSFFVVGGHLGYEVYPKWLTNSKVGFYLNTSTNHNMHHKYYRGNYALYFRWWDIGFNTTHKEYYKTLEEIQQRTASMKQNPQSAALNP